MENSENKITALENLAFLRLPQIIGDRSTTPPTTPLVPISKASLWAWVKAGKFPPPVKIGPRTTAWRIQDVRQWMVEQGGKRPKNKTKSRE